MRTEMKIERLRPLIIGHEMDNLTGIVEVDSTAWMTAYPELTRYTLAVTPPDGTPYFAPTEMEGTILRWIVRREDTAKAGEGSYQIIGTGENGEQKSTDFYPLYIYRNMPGLDGASETPPEAALAWVSKVLDAADRAEEAAERAENAGGSGGTGSAVNSVNGKTGAVQLTAADVGAADAKETAQAFDALSEEIEELKKGMPSEVPFEETGNFVQFIPDEGSELHVVTEFSEQSQFMPNLLLHHVNSKNLHDIMARFGGAGTVYEKDGITATVNADGTLTIKGQNNTSGYTNTIDIKDDSPYTEYIYPAGTYTIPEKMSIRAMSIDGLTSLGNKNRTFTVDVPFRIRGVYLAFAANAAVDMTIPLVMVSGAVLPESDFAYSGQIYKAYLSQYYASGRFNWTTGELFDAEGNYIETAKNIVPADIVGMSGENAMWIGNGTATVSGLHTTVSADVGASVLTASISGNRIFTTVARNAAAIAVESEINVKQLGNGTPSLTNIRRFEAYNTLNLYHEASFASVDVNAALTLTLDNAVYGGVIDWITGKIKITKAAFTFDGSEKWMQPAENRIACGHDFTDRLMTDSSYAGLLCDRYVAVYDSGAYCRWNAATGMLFQVYNPGMSLDEFKAMLAADPMTIVYDVVPYEIEIAPQTLEMYAGNNAIWYEGGATTLTYEVEISKVLRVGDEPVLKYGLPVMWLYGDTTGMTKDDAVDLLYDYDGRSGVVSVKWQGSSSINYDKKNYTFKFDRAFEAKAGWGAQKKYCFKANWIDASHSRNLVSAMLWGQIVKSRSGVPSDIAALPNGGAVDGFPCIIMLNGEFHGLYTWNIPKDGWMYGMGNGANEAIVCADDHTTATQFKGAATLDGDFELEYAPDEDNAEWVKTSLNALISACIASDGSDLDTAIAQRLDWGSAMDYYALVCLMRGDDNTDKNYILYTKDGTKWAFGAYDMDGTWGLLWSGKVIEPARFSMNNSIAGYAKLHRVMELIKTYKKDAFKARYNSLRKNELSEDNVATTFANFISQIPAEVYALERQKWPGIPSTSVNDLHQITDWYRRRVQVIDAEIEAL